MKQVKCQLATIGWKREFYFIDRDFHVSKLEKIEFKINSKAEY